MKFVVVVSSLHTNMLFLCCCFSRHRLFYVEKISQIETNGFSSFFFFFNFNFVKDEKHVFFLLVLLLFVSCILKITNKI